MRNDLRCAYYIARLMESLADARTYATEISATGIDDIGVLRMRPAATLRISGKLNDAEEILIHVKQSCRIDTSEIKNAILEARADIDNDALSSASQSIKISMKEVNNAIVNTSD